MSDEGVEQAAPVAAEKPAKAKAAKKQEKKTTPKVKQTGDMARVPNIRKSKSVKHVMELLDESFKYLKQRPPHMRAYEANPVPYFMQQLREILAKWPPAVLRQILDELTTDEVPKDDNALFGAVMLLMRFTFEGGGKSQPAYSARWRMWPYKRETKGEELSAQQKEEREMSKQATRKKVGSAKAAAKKSGGGATLKDDVKLKVVADSPKPKMEERQKIKNSIKGTMTVAAIVKKTGCKVGTLAAMIKKGFLEKAAA